jgi:hypothetical protein
VNAQTPGVGSNTIVAWNPDVHGFDNSSQPGSDIVLGHVMIQAAHNATGMAASGNVNADGIDVVAERNTVGLPASTYHDPGGANGPLPDGTPLPDTSVQPYTENALRADYKRWGIPSPATDRPPASRLSYYDPDPDGSPGKPF